MENYEEYQAINLLFTTSGNCLFDRPTRFCLRGFVHLGSMLFKDPNVKKLRSKIAQIRAVFVISGFFRLGKKRDILFQHFMENRWVYRKYFSLSELTGLFHKSLLAKNRGGKKGMQDIPTYIMCSVQVEKSLTSVLQDASNSFSTEYSSFALRSL